MSFHTLFTLCSDSALDTNTLKMFPITGSNCSIYRRKNLVILMVLVSIIGNLKTTLMEDWIKRRKGLCIPILDIKWMQRILNNILFDKDLAKTLTKAYNLKTLIISEKCCIFLCIFRLFVAFL